MNRSKNLPNAEQGRIDLPSLEEEARRSRPRESYRNFKRGEDHRIGVIVDLSQGGIPRFVIELTICVLGNRTHLDMTLLRRAGTISKVLVERGYALSHQDDGWILCERTLERDDVEDELLFLDRLIESEGSGHSGPGYDHIEPNEEVEE
jgi:hypothetical protein